MAYHDRAATVGEPIPLKEAAERMGVSVSALRGRLKRGTIEGEKDKEGRVLIYLPASDGETDATEGMLHEGESPEASVQPDIATPLNQLIEAIQCLHTDLANHDAGLERLVALHRDQFESNSNLESRMQNMERQIEAVHTAVKTMGAAFRIHAQETDRLIKALGRATSGGGSAASPAPPAFTPPTQKQRLFGRRQSDQEEAPPSDVTSS